MAQWIWRKRSLNFVKVFSLFRYYLPLLGKGWSPLFWTSLNSFYPNMLCFKIHWNWFSDSGEEDFVISSMYFCYFVIISLRGKGLSSSFEKTWIPFIQACFVPSFVEIGQVVLKKMFLFFLFCPFRYYISLEKFAHHPRMLCAKFGWKGLSGSREDENVKNLHTDRNTDRRTTDDWRLELKVHLIFQLRWWVNWTPPPSSRASHDIKDSVFCC